jgi:lysophospholipase L1-like esterase
MKKLYCLFIGLIGLSLLQWNCARQNPVNNVPQFSYSGWDTTCSFDNISFSTDSILAQSVLSKGNNFRLWKFLEKAGSGATVRIGFIGGSITAGAGVSFSGDDYASRFCAFVGNMFPYALVQQLNAGSGATNSRFASSRVQDDLLSNAPDLVIIEFGVNDDPLDSIGTMMSMEGLVRQCLQNQDVPVLMLFYMNQTGDTVDQSYHKRIGQHYGIPMISYRDVCWPLVASGKLHLDSIYYDGIHPNANGHMLCAYLLFSFLRHAVQANTPDPLLAVPAPIVSDLYQWAGIMKENDTILKVSDTGGWNDTLKEFNRLGFHSAHSGDTLIIITHAREFTIGYHYSPDLSAQMKVDCDGATFDTLSNNFSQGWPGGKTALRRVFMDTIVRPHTIRCVNLTNSDFLLDYLLYAK